MATSELSARCLNGSEELRKAGNPLRFKIPKQWVATITLNGQKGQTEPRECALISPISIKPVTKIATHYHK
ncbi:hypothetical protein Tco_1572013 [Tanacetum coccineum]